VLHTSLVVWTVPVMDREECVLVGPVGVRGWASVAYTHNWRLLAALRSRIG